MKNLGSRGSYLRATTMEGEGVLDADWLTLFCGYFKGLLFG